MDDEPVTSHDEVAGDVNAVQHSKIIQLVKAEGGSTIQGVVQQVFVGDYERLRDAYIHPWPVFERVNLDHFVGREWLLAEVDAFLRDNDRGYFILEADAGLGKTTFLAWLVQQRGYIHHLTLDPSSVIISLGNLATQLIRDWELEPYWTEGVLSSAASRPDLFQNLLFEAASKRDETRPGEKIVLVVDALDEADTPPGRNVLGLPQVLPEGVFLIGSQRSVPVTLNVDTATTRRCVFPLVASSDENQADMRRFLKRASTWAGIVLALQESGYTPEQFTATLLEKCRGVWVYLHYVIHEIERGERSPLDLDALPDGLTQYYARSWQRWRTQGGGKNRKIREEWYKVYRPLLTTLAAAQEAVALERIAEWSGVETPLDELRWIFNEQWRPFITVTGRGKEAQYRLYHSTLREFFDGRVQRENLEPGEKELVGELEEATVKAHNRLADRYLNVWGGSKTNLPGLQDAAQRDIDEGYGLRHVVAHLKAAGRANEVHNLLRLDRNVWYVAKEQAGDTSSYLTDLGAAWRLAEEEGKPGLQVRYALMVASLNSMAKNIPPALLTVLVEKGRWSPALGLFYAQQIPDSRQRAKALAELAPALPESLIGEALAAARVIKPEASRVDALIGLARFLPGALIGEALEAVQAIDSDEERVRAVVGLAPYLTEPLKGEVIQEALATVRELLGSIWTYKLPPIDLSVELLFQLSEPQRGNFLRETLEAAQAIWYEWARARALVVLIPHLPEPLLKEALSTARATEDFDGRAYMFAALASCLLEPLKEEVIREALIAFSAMPGTQVRLIDGKPAHAIVLARLVPHLPESLLTEALTAAQKIEFEGARAWALAELAPYLSKSLLRNALDAVRTIGVEEYQATALIGLLSRLGDLGYPEEALAIARSLRSGRARAEAFAGLVPHLPEPLRGDAVQEALPAALSAIGGDTWRLDALTTLAPYVAESLLHEVVASVRTLPAQGALDDNPRARALASLAPRLSAELLPEALIAAQFVGDEEALTDALTGITLGLVELGFPREALAFAQQIDDESRCARMLRELAPRLAEPFRGDALNAIQAIPKRDVRLQTLVALTPYLPEKLLREAQSAAQRIEGREERALLLIKLAPRLAELGHPEQAMRLVQAKPVVGLASYLPEPFLQKTLAMTWGTYWESAQARTLVAMAPHLPKPLLQKSLVIMRSIGWERTRAEALAGLAPHLPEPLRGTAFQEALAVACDVEGEYDRSEVLVTVIPVLPEPLLRIGLEVIRAIENKQNRAESLVGLLPHLPEPLVEKALKWDLEAIREIDSDQIRVRLLTKLAPHMLPELYEEVVRLVLEISPTRQVEAFTPFIIQIGIRGYCEEALELAQSIGSQSMLAEVVVNLAPRLPKRLLSKAWTLACELPNSLQAEVLASLAPYLREPLRSEALGKALPTVRELDEAWWKAGVRTKLLAQLAPPLAELSTDTCYSLWCETLPVLASRLRRDLLADLQALTPVIVAVGGADAVGEIVSAIQDVGQWWP